MSVQLRTTSKPFLKVLTCIVSSRNTQSYCCLRPLQSTIPSWPHSSTLTKANWPHSVSKTSTMHANQSHDESALRWTAAILLQDLTSPCHPPNWPCPVCSYGNRCHCHIQYKKVNGGPTVSAVSFELHVISTLPKEVRELASGVTKNVKN